MVVPGSWLRVANLSLPSRTTQYIPSNVLCWRAPGLSIFSLVRRTLISTFQVHDLLLECFFESLSFVASSIDVHSCCDGEFSSDCSRDLSSKPFWRLVDWCVLEDDSVFGWPCYGLYRSEQRLFCSEDLECARGHLCNVLESSRNGDELGVENCPEDSGHVRCYLTHDLVCVFLSSFSQAV